MLLLKEFLVDYCPTMCDVQQSTAVMSECRPQQTVCNLVTIICIISRFPRSWPILHKILDITTSRRNWPTGKRSCRLCLRLMTPFVAWSSGFNNSTWIKWFKTNGQRGRDFRVSHHSHISLANTIGHPRWSSQDILVNKMIQNKRSVTVSSLGSRFIFQTWKGFLCLTPFAYFSSRYHRTS